MAYSNSKKRTGSVGKLNIEQTFVNEVIKRHGTTHGWNPELCVYPSLVGHAVEFPRHDDQRKLAGIPEENTVYIERNYELCTALKVATRRVGYKGYVVHGDYKDTVLELLQEGSQIPFMDFDGTDTLGEYHIDMLHMIDEYSDQIGLVMINASLRNYTHCTPEEFVTLSEKITGRYTYFMPYRGEGPMGMFFLSTEPIEMVKPDDPRHLYAFEQRLRGIHTDSIALGLVEEGYQYVQPRQINNWIQSHRPHVFAQR